MNEGLSPDEQLAAQGVPVAPHSRSGSFDRRRPQKTQALPKSAAWIAWLMDDAIPLFGGRRVGVDGFLSFIPGLGDAAGFAMSATVIYSGIQAGASAPTLVRMTLNALGETLFSLIPGLGIIVSFVWKANQRNLKIVEAELADHDATTRTSVEVLAWTVGLIALTLAVVIGTVSLALFALYRWIRG